MKYHQFLHSYLFLTLNPISILLVISISILSFSVYKHHNNFFLSIYDFIVVVKSSRVAVFFISNAIVIAIFFRSFKPNFKKDHDHYCCIPVSSTPADYPAYHDHQHDVKEEANGQDDYEDDEDYFSAEDDLYHGNISDGYDEDDDDDDGGDDTDDSLFGSEEDYGYDDEETYIDLQRRSEEFIAKNNKRWIEELRNERFLYTAAATEVLTPSSI